MVGWLVNDYLTCIENTKTFWHDLLDWFPDLIDKTGIPFSSLADEIEKEASIRSPDYIIRNATYFRKLNLSIPIISLLQDISDNPIQKEVLNHSNIIVVNSEYTLSCYSYLKNDSRVKIIPLGTNFDLFKPISTKENLRKTWNIEGNVVCFIGAQSDIKGWSKLVEIIEQSPNYNFVLILKDDQPVKLSVTNYKVFNRVNHKDLVQIINACDVGICTSITETQHLAGIEMGACGLPLMTTNVGAYFNRPSGDWGFVYDNPIADLNRLFLIKNKVNSRNYWLKKGFDLKSCKQSWINIINELEFKNT